MTNATGPAADELLVAFATVLRKAGMAVTADRTSAFVQAVALTGFDDRASTYWSGRATLCSSLDDTELYDKAFTAWFTTSPEVHRAESRISATPRSQAILDDESRSGDQERNELIAVRTTTTESSSS